MEQSTSWEADQFSASQEIRSFYGTRMFITTFTTGPFPSGFPTKTQYTPLPHTCYMLHPFHSRCDHPNNIRWAVQIIKLLIM